MLQYDYVYVCTSIWHVQMIQSSSRSSSLNLARNYTQLRLESIYKIHRLFAILFLGIMLRLVIEHRLELYTARAIKKSAKQLTIG